MEGISELICEKFITAQKKISYYDIDNRIVFRENNNVKLGFTKEKIGPKASKPPINKNSETWQVATGVLPTLKELVAQLA